MPSPQSPSPTRNPPPTALTPPVPVPLFNSVVPCTFQYCPLNVLGAVPASSSVPKPYLRKLYLVERAAVGDGRGDQQVAAVGVVAVHPAVDHDLAVVPAARAAVAGHVQVECAVQNLHARALGRRCADADGLDRRSSRRRPRSMKIWPPVPRSSVLPPAGPIVSQKPSRISLWPLKSTVPLLPTTHQASSLTWSSLSIRSVASGLAGSSSPTWTQPPPAWQYTPAGLFIDQRAGLDPRRLLP